MVEYSFSIDGSVLTIFDSWKVSKHNFRFELTEIKDANPDKKIFERTTESLINEWAVHSFCYMIGYQRERTKDCDFDNPCDKPEWLYCLLGNLVWIFIK